MGRRGSDAEAALKARNHEDSRKALSTSSHQRDRHHPLPLPQKLHAARLHYLAADSKRRSPRSTTSVNARVIGARSRKIRSCFDFNLERGTQKKTGRRMKVQCSKRLSSCRYANCHPAGGEGFSNISSTARNNHQAAHHSPRAFSLFTLEEYLREKSVSPLPRQPPSPTHILSNGEVYLEASSRLNSSCESSSCTLPLLSADKLQAQLLATTRRPRPHPHPPPDAMHFRDDVSSSIRAVPGHSSHHPCPSIFANAEEDVETSSAHAHGCVPWPAAAGAHKAKKSKMVMTMLAKSSSNSRRITSSSAAAKNYRRRQRPPSYNCIGKPATFSTGSLSETALLLTEPELFFQHEDAGAKVAMADQSSTRLMDGSRRKLRAETRCLGQKKKGSRYTHHCNALEPVADPVTAKSKKSNHSNPRRQASEGRATTSVEMHRSLGDKYKPKCFEEMVGQSMVVQALTNAVLRGKVAPLYLFQGPRGSGKTTAARLFAAALNCSSVDNVRHCGGCDDCKELASERGNFVSEFDGSSNNGIDSMKALLKLVGGWSDLIVGHRRGRHNVAIIDDCQMLTKEAWNLFQKVMQDIPSRAGGYAGCVLILITTDQQQIPGTVVSRCQKYNFLKIKEADMMRRLRELASAETMDIDNEALKLITVASDGSLRDAETILDQISILCQKVTTSTVRELLGLVPNEKLVELLELALSTDTVSTVRSIKELTDAGVDPLALMSQLATLITDLLAGNSSPTMSAKSTRRSSSFFGHRLSKCELEKLRQALKILSEAEKQLRRACNDRTTWLTAALLQFSNGNSCDDPNSRTIANSNVMIDQTHNLQHGHHSFATNGQGTSVTQSPLAFMDTVSEKETSDHRNKDKPLIAADILSIRPPWERREDDEQDADTDEATLINRNPTADLRTTRFKDRNYQGASIASLVGGSQYRRKKRTKAAAAAPATISGDDINRGGLDSAPSSTQVGDDINGKAAEFNYRNSSTSSLPINGKAAEYNYRNSSTSSLPINGRVVAIDVTKGKAADNYGNSSTPSLRINGQAHCSPAASANMFAADAARRKNKKRKQKKRNGSFPRLSYSDVSVHESFDERRQNCVRGINRGELPDNHNIGLPQADSDIDNRIYESPTFKAGCLMCWKPAARRPSGAQPKVTTARPQTIVKARRRSKP